MTVNVAGPYGPPSTGVYRETRRAPPLPPGSCPESGTPGRASRAAPAESRCTTSRERPGTRSNGNCRWNCAPLFTARPLDARRFLLQVAGVLDGRLDTGEIQIASVRVEIESELVTRHEIRQPYLGLSEQLRGRDAIASSRANQRGLEHREIALEYRSRRDSKRVPAVVANQPKVATRWRQPQVRVVDAQAEAGARRAT